MKMRCIRSLVTVAVLVCLAAPSGMHAAGGARLVNLSSRGAVGAGDDVVIAGFVVGGTAAKDLLIRAVGPTLSSQGVSGVLGQPRLQIFDTKGTVVAANTQWDATLGSAFDQVGAFSLPAGSQDAALRVSLAPGAYTAMVSGATGAGGIALVEVYEMDGTSQLMNLSTRAHVQSGDGLLISGLVVSGGGSRRVLIRAVGPGLVAQGVVGAMVDPSFRVLDANGAVVATNDNWGDAGAAATVSNVEAAVGAFPFADGSKDAAAVVDLAAGRYSILIQGAGGSTGIAMLEVYDAGAGSATATGSAASSSSEAIYAAASLSWDSAAITARLGPTFAELNPGAADDRPTLYKPDSKVPSSGYYVRINPYEIGTAPGPDSDFWSDSGQVAYIPDDPVNDPGLDRIQTFAYYNQVFAISPRLDWASGQPHPDPQTRESAYVALAGGTPMQPVAMVRNYAMEQNEAIVIYRNGLFAVAGTQTSRSGSERPYPGFVFPKNKVPRAVAVTASNEFALVAVWDTDRHIGQLAVVALEGKFLAFHTWPYMGLPNQGSWSDFKLLGYVDLPMSSPNSVAAASNGLWAGPSSTDGKVLSQIDLGSDGYRALVYDGAWQSVVAKNGYAIVASTDDNVVAILDLTPLFSYMRESYLSSETSLQATLASRGPAPDQFPQTFDVNPSIMPTLVWSKALTKPTAVLAGLKIDRWSVDRYKAYVATQDGTVHILDASPLMWRNSWETNGTLQEIGTVKIGRNPVGLAFVRHGETGLPLIPNDSTGAQRASDPLNNLLYAACRGDREIDAIVTWGGQGQVYRRIRDSRMGDPVAVSVAVRGNIVSVADFAGKKILSFRIGAINDTRNNKVYGCGPSGTDAYEFAGELSLKGSPFMLNSTNVN